jgi:hypothetical protein
MSRQRARIATAILRALGDFTALATGFGTLVIAAIIIAHGMAIIIAAILYDSRVMVPWVLSGAVACFLICGLAVIFRRRDS